MEFFAWRQFRNRRQVGGLAGLTDTHYQSGDMPHEQGISKAGNRWVRALAINTAWAWLRFQPKSQLARWYQKRFGKGSSRIRKIGIVALARKLLIAFWRYLDHGLLPEGAVLRGERRRWDIAFRHAWRERLAMAVGSQGPRPWHRSLEGVRSSPCFNFALGGFTKFGCSTGALAVDTDRRLLTGDDVRERLEEAASRRRNV